MNDATNSDVLDSLPPLNTVRHLRFDEICVQGRYSIEIKDSGIPIVWSWYLLEGEREEEDWEFWGLVSKKEKEFEQFTLSELEGIAKSWKSKLQWDGNMKSKLLSQVMEKLGLRWYNSHSLF
jgi:hypothetical protein